MDQNIAWLDYDALLHISERSAPDPSMMAQRYDATRSSEFYRGYATVVAQIADAIRMTSGPTVLRQQIDELDAAVMSVPDGECQTGASFALANVAGYAQNGTVPQVSVTLDAELVCIAHCFLRNQALGL